ncbi:MAG: pirin [Bacteroidetes bacterium B1(2017)]|nr:MAG: pirin [Bacteroidetes bacterium B1(2017)]
MKDKLARRSFLSRVSIGLGALLSAPFVGAAKIVEKMEDGSMEKRNPIKQIKPMGFMWETADPFLFCVHHEDQFPKGTETLGPPPSAFVGRSMGDDFIIKDGYRMYHGQTVPGFPGHPHRGFETITVVRKGLVDHADSLGAAGRYGNGDVQWMTAGKGVQHSEMFPLLNQDKENPLELFQIWLNLPAKDKMVEPHFKMLWGEKIPKINHVDNAGKKTLVEVMAGNFGKHKALSPPPNSWASAPDHEVAVWNILMQEGASINLPAASNGVNRTLYFYEGSTLKINGESITRYHAVTLEPDMELTLESGAGETSILVLQGKPIGEHVIQYGPFVMNTKDEINQAFEDYHRTQFGGWPWSRYDQVHERTLGRFAKHADGHEERPA